MGLEPSDREAVNDRQAGLPWQGRAANWALILAGVFFGLLVLAVAYRFGPTTHGLVALPTAIVLALGAITDIKRKTIPDYLTLTGLAWILAASLYLGLPRAVEALIGALACGGALLILAMLRRGSIGGGDVKLMAVIGAALGWRWGFGALMFAQLAAALVAACLLVTRRKRRKDGLPFGPFLSTFAILATLVKPL